MKTKIIEIYEWYGVIAIVIAYALISFSVLQTTNIWYQFLNISGALGIVIGSFYKKDYQSGVLNIVWIIIAIIAIARMMY